MVEMSTAIEQTKIIQINDPCDVTKEKSGEAEAIQSNGEKTEVSKSSSAKLQYSREEMMILEKTDLALLRPYCLNAIFDREGRWDPMAWHSGNEQSEAEPVPVGTLEFRKRTRSNAADTKDVEVILSPQRMSFGNGCTGAKVPPPTDLANSNTKRLNGLLPKNKFDKASERPRDPDREKHLQKINGNYSGNREQIRKAIRDLHENRDKGKEAPTKEEEESWIRNSEYSADFKPDHKPYKDTKYSANCNGSGKKNWNNPRRNSERSADDEPEWFTSGPTSRLDTIELKGFEDDDKLHPIEAAPEKDEFDSNSKVREDEHAMDPLGSHEMNNASNHYANESNYSTGLQEDWDPTHPKFNVEALLDPQAFVEEGKDLLEAEKSINLSNNRGIQMDFWAGANNASSPKDFPNAGQVQPRPDGSPSAPSKDGPASFAADVHFGENMATSNLKAMLGVNESVQAGSDPGMMSGMSSQAPSQMPGHQFMNDARNGNIRPSLDDPVIKQLLHNDKNIKQENLIRQSMLAAQSMPRDLREMFHRSEQHLPPSGPMLPHPGPVMTPRHPVPEQMLRDPRLSHDPRIIDPRLVDPRFTLPTHLQHGGNKQVPPPRNGQELLKAVKNDPAQLDKVISCLHNALKLGTAPPESQPTMHALLREMEKAKNDHIKLQKLQLLANAQHQLHKHHDQIELIHQSKLKHGYDVAPTQPTQQQLIRSLQLKNIHDKTQALKALLRLPGQGAQLMSGQPRMSAVPQGPPREHAMFRPRMTGDESIPTRITNHHPDHRMLMGNKQGFPMAFTPTSVMIKSSEIRNFGKSESVEVEHNINLTPSHIQQPPAARFNYRPGEAPGGPNIPNGRRSPQFDEVPKPVPTIETSRGGPGKLQFPPSAFSAPMKGMHAPPPPHNFMMHQQLAKGIPHSPHGPQVPPPHLTSQLVMQELMHSNKPTFNHPGPQLPPPIASSNVPSSTF